MIVSVCMAADRVGSTSSGDGCRYASGRCVCRAQLADSRTSKQSCARLTCSSARILWLRRWRLLCVKCVSRPAYLTRAEHTTLVFGVLAACSRKLVQTERQIDSTHSHQSICACRMLKLYSRVSETSTDYSRSICCSALAAPTVPCIWASISISFRCTTQCINTR